MQEMHRMNGGNTRGNPLFSWRIVREGLIAIGPVFTVRYTETKRLSPAHNPSDPSIHPSDPLQLG